MAPAVKDVNGPKKPLSAYIAWQGSARESVVKSMPEGYSFGDLAKKFSATWKEMSESTKAPFEKKAKAELEKYHKAMDKYKLTDNYKKFQELKAQSKVDAVKKSKFRKDENAPKRPPNGYFLFMQSKKDALAAEGLAFTEVSKKCGSLWNGMSDAEKKPFEDKSAAAKKKYDADLAKYQNTGKYKKYMAEKAAFEANKKDELKKAKGDGKKETSAKKVKGSKSKSRSRSSSKSKKVKKSKSRSRSRSKSKKKKSKSRSRSKAKKAKRSKSRSRSKKRSRSRSRSRSKKSKKSKSRSRSRKPKAAKRQSKSRSRKSKSRSARRASKPKAPKSSAKKAAKPKAAKSKSRSRSRKRSRSRSAKKAKRSRSRSAKKAKKEAAPKDAPKDVAPK